MPVSFNVPKTTKRSKFVVDQFQGVDYTSAGIDVDPTRSPDAPNMVRHTPGKVRKRMGYKKAIQFGAKTNVNYAIGTSAIPKEVKIDETQVGIFQPLYSFSEGLARGAEENNVYYEFDYKSEYDFKLGGGHNITIPASEDWTHYSGDIYYETNWTDQVGIRSEVPQSIYIKNFSAMRAKDDNYKWSPAPDKLIETEVSNTVYSAHHYRTSRDRNKRDYTNINRVEGSLESVLEVAHDTEWHELRSNKSGTPPYVLVEEVYRNLDNTIKRTLYIEFDYWFVGPEGNTASISIANKIVSGKLYATEGLYEQHFSAIVNVGNYTSRKIEYKFDSLSPTRQSLQLERIFVGYAKDENYQWEFWPEFYDPSDSWTPDLYYKGKRNYSEINDYYYRTGFQDPSDVGISAPVIQTYATGVDGVKGFFYAKAHIHVVDYSNLGAFNSVKIRCIDNQGYTISGSEQQYTSSSYHAGGSDFDYETYAGASDTRFPCYIRVTVSWTSSLTNVDVAFSCSGIEIRSISPRDITDTVDESYEILHVGPDLWLSAGDEAQKIASNISRQKSWAEQFNDDLIILDGKNIFTYTLGESGAFPVEGQLTYIPQITIGKSPSGGGTSYEPLNLLNPGFIDGFTVTSAEATATQFQLSFGNLDVTPVRAWRLYANGTWQEKIEGYNFTVNRSTGVVTFSEAPGVTPISGEDNIRIQAYHTIDGYRDRIAKCRFAKVYGVNGRPDRLFVGGNPEYPSRDFFSQQDDYGYFPDINYSNLGAYGGEITGYISVGNYLGTFKKESDDSQALIIRSGEVMQIGDDPNYAVFKIIDTLHGSGPLTPYSVGYLNGEPLYMAKDGIYAVASMDVTGKDYGQSRSYFLKGKLTQEPNLEDVMATTFKDTYVAAVNSHLYILDGMLPTSTENDPYSTRQYAGFYCDNIPATCIWTYNDELWFGTADGRICKFYTDPDDLNSYSDDGYPITAWWDTPDLDGYLFYKNKTFRYFAVRLMKAFKTSFKLYSEKLSVWTFVKEEDKVGRTFDFRQIDFARFSFSTDRSEKISHTKLRIKKVDKARFRLENSRLNEPFGIYDLALEYLENGNYKR